ncbi:hypothetical protein ITJ57_12090 [Plantibacter sp. VKM Ac-2880]|uniref:hypothetical protein n=1 Tax=Plantibacter sp. VKM Ac-2880 TaxID=2783827 RepID=UPI00188EA3D3|nr:hypothetical protein [Plantibacter sp. VKM Ac-2880]MBF4569501.1 hypothetical protein [Plantibacter sp. VKM Ac-2880]
MKLIEYLAPLKNSSQQARILASMYFLEATEDKSTFTTGDIRAQLAAARVPNLKTWNIAARLGAAGHLVHADGATTARIWELTSSGRTEIAAWAPPLPVEERSVIKKAEAAALRGKVAAISDPETKAFASEAVDCLDVGAHRAAIVFMWVAAVHEVQERLWNTSDGTSITAAAQSHNPRAKVCKKRDDLSEYNEELLLQVAHDLGIIDKNEKAELIKALGLRNSSGHPNKLRPGEHRAKAHIEDLITMLF